MTKKPHESGDRLNAIKHGLRKRLEVEREAARASAEQAKLAAERVQAAAAEEAQREAERAAAQKKQRPWKLASFSPAPKAPHPEPEPTVESKADAKAEANSVETSLEAIYIAEDGELPDMRKLERRRSRAWLYRMLSVGGFAGIVSLAAWTGFLFFQPFRGFHGSGLTLAWEGPTAIALGREETFSLDWSNPDPNPLNQATVRLSLPPDFVPTSLEPAPSDRTLMSWNLGFVPAGGRGNIIVKGVFTGALDTQSAVQAIGTYRPLAYTHDYDALATLPLLYKDTALEGVAALPQKILSGDSVNLRYTVINHGIQPIAGLLMRIRYPDGFIPNPMTSSTPPVASPEHEAWFSVGELKPETSTTLSFVGAFASGASGELAFDAEAGRLGTDGSFEPMQRTEADASVVPGDLDLHAVVNGSESDSTLEPGDPLRFSVAYHNSSPETLKDVAVTIGFESFIDGKSATGTSLLDWTRLEDPSQGASTTAARVQTLRYDKKNVPALEELAPLSEGTLEFSLPSLALTTTTKDASVRLTVQAVVGSLGGVKVSRTVRAAPIVVRYRSDADLSVAARYFTEEGAPMGFGPLPPQVGKTTAYRITWHIHKQLHDLENLTVSAVLPKTAAWDDKTFVDAGTVAFDNASRTVTWALNRMPDGVDDLEVSFEIQLTPGPNDANRFADLLGETRFQATDPVTGEPLLKTKPGLTSDLENDEGAKGKGVVRSP